MKVPARACLTGPWLMNEYKATPINHTGFIFAPSIGEVWYGVTTTVKHAEAAAKKLSQHFNEGDINGSLRSFFTLCAVCVYVAVCVRVCVHVCLKCYILNPPTVYQQPIRTYSIHFSCVCNANKSSTICFIHLKICSRATVLQNSTLTCSIISWY